MRFKQLIKVEADWRSWAEEHLPAADQATQDRYRPDSIPAIILWDADGDQLRWSFVYPGDFA